MKKVGFLCMIFLCCTLCACQPAPDIAPWENKDAQSMGKMQGKDEKMLLSDIYQMYVKQGQTLFVNGQEVIFTLHAKEGAHMTCPVVSLVLHENIYEQENEAYEQYCSDFIDLTMDDLYFEGYENDAAHMQKLKNMKNAQVEKMQQEFPNMTLFDIATEKYYANETGRRIAQTTKDAHATQMYKEQVPMGEKEARKLCQNHLLSLLKKTGVENDFIISSRRFLSEYKAYWHEMQSVHFMRLYDGLSALNSSLGTRNFASSEAPFFDPVYYHVDDKKICSGDVYLYQIRERLYQDMPIISPQNALSIALNGDETPKMGAKSKGCIRVQLTYLPVTVHNKQMIQEKDVFYLTPFYTIDYYNYEADYVGSEWSVIVDALTGERI